MKSEFESLEKKISGIAGKSISISTHLSKLDKEKEASVLTFELLGYLLAFMSAHTSAFPELFKDMENYETAAKDIYFLNEVAKNFLN